MGNSQAVETNVAAQVVTKIDKQEHSRLQKLYDNLSSTYYTFEVDRFTKFWILLVNAQATDHVPDSSVVKNIEPKRILDVSPGHAYGTNLAIRFTDLDEDLGDLDGDMFGYIQGALFLKTHKFEMNEETQNFFPSPQRGAEIGRATMPKALPKIIEPWDDLVSDEAMSLLAFYGLGQYYLQSARNALVKDVPGAVYEIDLSFLFAYETRPPFERYGAIAVYDKDEALIGMYWCLRGGMFYPIDAEWEHVKYVFRVCLFTAITLKEHLALIHWQISNTLLFASRQSFEPDRPMRRLIKPHTYRSVLINLGSKDLLLPTHGIAYRMFAIAEKDWYRAVYDVTVANKYQPFADYIAAKRLPAGDADRLPYYQDGSDLFAVIRKYVAAYLGVYYQTDADVLADPDMHDYWGHYQAQPMFPSFELPALGLETLIDQVAHAIFGVTAGHEMVGSLVEYIINPAGLGAKINPGKAEADVQTYLQTCFTISLTGVPQPMLINDWSHIHLHDNMTADQRAAIATIINQFQTDLQHLAAEIDVRNLTRKKRFMAMSPSVLECSCSI